MLPIVPQIVRDPTTGLDRLTLSRLPTPLDDAPRLAEALGIARLAIKREDMAGYALGGNKMRQLDFILAQALAAGADMLVTTAGSQSNFCRSLAGAAAKLGLGCHLHLRAAMGTDLVGNLLLDTLFGATVTFTAVTDPWDTTVADEMAAIAADYAARGRKPFIVQLTGVSAAVGVAGWMSGAAELAGDFAARGAVPDVMVVVCGSGLSLAGLALGFKHLGCRTRLLGISAQQPEPRLRDWIVSTAAAASDLLGIATRLAADDFDIIDSEIGPGYGKPSAASVAAVRLAGQTEGLVLDPVYTGKGMAGVVTAIRTGAISPADSVVFLHSGGTPGLFTHAEAFADAFANDLAGPPRKRGRGVSATPLAPRHGPARLDLPLDRPGRHVGALRLPWSHDRSAYGQVVIPVIVINGGPGPTVLCTGGVHGDEYEGPIVLGALARNLAPEDVRGRIIIMPTANPAAAMAGRRTSPIDGGNLARLFPGDAEGGVTSQIAEGITRLLLPEADFLLDFHSGGSTLDYQPCAFGRLPGDAGLAGRVLDLLTAFGADITAVVKRPEAKGTLVATALDLGVVAMATELGGAGGVTRHTVAIAATGLRRTLAHMGILTGDSLAKDGPPGLSPEPARTRLLAIGGEHFLRAPGRGLFEPAFTLGDRVAAGDIAGWLSDPERPERPPEALQFGAPGLVLCRRVPTMAEPGDVLTHLGEDTTREALLAAL